LPFLQMAAPGARIVPLYVGRMTDSEREAAASDLAAAWEPGTVFLASSDFTHYGRNFGFTPFPSDQNAGRRLRELDFSCIEAAGSVDAGLFLETLAETGATVCGADPIALLLDVLSRLSPDIYQTVLDYQTSGQICGDFRHSVSYAGLAYHPRSAFVLEPLDCESLIESAAGTLEQLRRTGKREAVPARGGSPALEGRRGLFVTLSCGDELLGCIGNCQAREPLAIEAPELALSAALDDPRFEPAAARSGPIDVEISVLTPLRRIRGAGSFQVGKHGGLLRLGAHSGLLLPQVAEGHEWIPGDFLSALARKSMLGPDAWRDPKARLFVFAAQVFSRPGLRGQS